MLGIEDTIAQYGIQGLMLIWFMFRTEKVITANTKTLKDFAVAVKKCKKK